MWVLHCPVTYVAKSYNIRWIYVSKFTNYSYHCIVFWSELNTMSGEQQQFFLKWNDFQVNMMTSFRNLRNDKSFTDVTLACEGQTCKAHKMVLSACSPYFKALLQVNLSQNKSDQVHQLFLANHLSYSSVCRKIRPNIPLSFWKMFHSITFKLSSNSCTPVKWTSAKNSYQRFWKLQIDWKWKG